MSLGDKIRKARDDARKTQEQVAEALKLTKGAVSQWENDKTVPELEYLIAFCRYVNASADEILLERPMDPLLRQLVQIWERLSSDGRDSLLGNANRILTDEKPEPGDHNPFGGVRSPKANKHGDGLKRGKRSRL